MTTTPLTGCLRRLLISLLGVTACALIIGWAIGSVLTGGRSTTTSATPLPMAAALENIQSLRVSFRAQTTSVTLLTGEGVFVAPNPDQPPDFYLTWRSTDPPLEEHILLINGRFYTRPNAAAAWTENAAYLSEMFNLISQVSGERLPFNPIAMSLPLPELTADMDGWQRLPDSTLDGRPVMQYTRPDLSITFWRILFPQYYLLFQSAHAEIAIGIADNLPYQLRYHLNLGMQNVNEELLFTVRLSGFNEPITLTAPESG